MIESTVWAAVPDEIKLRVRKHLSEALGSQAKPEWAYLSLQEKQTINSVLRSARLFAQLENSRGLEN